jgi:hypothetical protein
LVQTKLYWIVGFYDATMFCSTAIEAMEKLGTDRMYLQWVANDTAQGTISAGNPNNSTLTRCVKVSNSSDFVISLDFKECSVRI